MLKSGLFAIDSAEEGEECMAEEEDCDCDGCCWSSNRREEDDVLVPSASLRSPSSMAKSPLGRRCFSSIAGGLCRRWWKQGGGWLRGDVFRGRGRGLLQCLSSVVLSTFLCARVVVAWSIEKEKCSWTVSNNFPLSLITRRSPTSTPLHPSSGPPHATQPETRPLPRVELPIQDPTIGISMPSQRPP